MGLRKMPRVCVCVRVPQGDEGSRARADGEAGELAQIRGGGAQEEEEAAHGAGRGADGLRGGGPSGDRGVGAGVAKET